jgi:regulator of sirC expression with transglutaminase-like and TPR domain
MRTWEDIAGLPEDGFGLAEAALILARDEYPELAPQDYLSRLSEYADILKSRVDIGSGAVSGEAVSAMNELLFDELGFTGNRVDYFNPRNSYLNEVMDRKLGIPITLSVVCLEVAHQAGMPLAGVAFPGHFLLKYRGSRGEVFIDPFSRGAVLGETELNRLLARAFGKEAPRVKDAPQLLAACGKKQILLRMLRNLKGIHETRDDRDRMLRVLNRILLLVPDSPPELRDRAALLEKLECYHSALVDLDRFRRHVPDADADAEFAQLWARLNQSAPPYH